MDVTEELIGQIEKFCDKSITPFIEEDDDNETFRHETFTQLGELGLTGMIASEDQGGFDLGFSNYCRTLETVAKYSVSYAITISVSNMVQGIISQFGNHDQKAKYLPALISGEEIGAFCLSESTSGSDAASLQLTAKKESDAYILNGNKMWITSAGVAKTYVVMARTGVAGSKGISAFIVREGTPGFSFGKREKKMGWKISPTRELVFENCKIPAENLIGQEREGFKVALTGLEKGRVTVASIAIGLGQRALDEAVSYAIERKQFNQSIFDFQGLQFMMTDMATELEAARSLVEKAAKLIEKGLPAAKLASMAKLKSTEMAMRVSTDSVQILGGVGYTREYPVERLMRNAKALQIVEGTNQIQKIVIAKNLKKEMS